MISSVHNLSERGTTRRMYFSACRDGLSSFPVIASVHNLSERGTTRTVYLFRMCARVIRVNEVKEMLSCCDPAACLWCPCVHVLGGEQRQIMLPYRAPRAGSF